MMFAKVSGNKFISSKTLFLQKISLFSAIVIVFLMPTYIWFIPPFMVLWGISWTLEMFESKQKISISFNNNVLILFLLFMGFYLWQLIGISYSEERITGWRFFLSRLSLLLFPLVLLLPGEIIRLKISLLLKVFATSTSFFIIVCFGFAFYRSYNILDGNLIFNPHPPEAGWMNYFYRYYFSINQHPSYLSVYVLLSVFISIENSLDRSLKRVFKFLWILSAILLMVSIFFLSSRTGIMVLLLLLPVYMVVRLKEINRILIIVSILSLTAVSSIIIIKTNSRVNLIYNSIKTGMFKEIAIKDGRVLIWKASLKPIMENIVLGVGTGGVNSTMEKEYLKLGNEQLLKNKYNLHDQFLEVQLENGLIGLLLFLSIIGFMIYIAISQSNLLYGTFIMIMVVFFLFETALNRLQGVSFFSLFSFLLIYLEPSKNLSYINIWKTLK
jgi:O-antigen ligase